VPGDVDEEVEAVRVAELLLGKLIVLGLQLTFPAGIAPLQFRVIVPLNPLFDTIWTI
jgi:hypothetical protein